MLGVCPTFGAETRLEGIYLWFGARKWIRAPKWIVVTGLFFDGNGETYMKCWEAQNLLKSMFCCDMSIFFDGNGETYMKCWEAQNLLKNMFVVTCLFFDGNGETYMKCWEAQNLLKSMFCCDMSNFLMEMAKLTWNAEKHKICWKTCFVVTCLFFLKEMAKLTWNPEKQVMLRSKKYLLKSMFCCDMSIFFDGKNLNYWCLIGEHSRNTQTGTKRYGRFIFCIYLHDTMETFFGSFLLCW